MALSFFFYDLETSGISPRDARIMQFAGQRTDLQLRPMGEPVNWLIKLSNDILPDPDAILVTGITPQKVNAEGISEAEFLAAFNEQVSVPGTIFTGFNSIRFDDEFMRFTHYRNFYDAYEWEWQDGRGRWDLLDVVRMTRALRPEGLKWPVDSSGKPANRLELLTAINGLEHSDAHDALSDVRATIELARLLRSRQPKMFDYLLSMRSKQKVATVVNAKQPFVYTSGKYPTEYEKTAVVCKVTDHPTQPAAALVYDLRHDPRAYFSKTPAELVELWQYKKDAEELRLPVKTLRFNRCPAVAPLGVLDEPSQVRLQVDLESIKRHYGYLREPAAQAFKDSLQQAVNLLDEQQQTRLMSAEQDVDTQLYDGFIANADKLAMSAVRAADPADLDSFADSLTDSRLKALLPLYKARNFPASLNDEERGAWEAFRTQRLTAGGKASRLQRFATRWQELAAAKQTTKGQHYLLTELQLYVESIMPDPESLN